MQNVEWQLRALTLQLQDAEEFTRDMQLLRVTRELQELIRVGGHSGLTEAEKERMEKKATWLKQITSQEVAVREAKRVAYERRRFNLEDQNVRLERKLKTLENTVQLRLDCRRMSQRPLPAAADTLSSARNSEMKLLHGKTVPPAGVSSLDLSPALKLLAAEQQQQQRYGSKSSRTQQTVVIGGGSYSSRKAMTHRSSAQPTERELTTREMRNLREIAQRQKEELTFWLKERERMLAKTFPLFPPIAAPASQSARSATSTHRAHQAASPRQHTTKLPAVAQTARLSAGMTGRCLID